MKLPLLLLFLIVAVSHAEAPRLFRERQFTSRDLAEAVNYFITSGEDRAVQELAALCRDGHKPSENGIRISERVAWVCRILFLPKHGQPIRKPGFGGGTLLYLTMPLQRWPLYPVAAAGDCFFVLGDGSIVFGMREDPGKYLTHCRAAGVFRTTTIAIPTREQAAKCADALRASPAWKAIQWKYAAKENGYNLSEERTWAFIQGQTNIAG